MMLELEQKGRRSRGRGRSHAVGQVVIERRWKLRIKGVNEDVFEDT